MAASHTGVQVELDEQARHVQFGGPAAGEEEQEDYANAMSEVMPPHGQVATPPSLPLPSRERLERQRLRNGVAVPAMQSLHDIEVAAPKPPKLSADWREVSDQESGDSSERRQPHKTRAEVARNAQAVELARRVERDAAISGLEGLLRGMQARGGAVTGAGVGAGVGAGSDGGAGEGSPSEMQKQLGLMQAKLDELKRVVASEDLSRIGSSPAPLRRAGSAGSGGGGDGSGRGSRDSRSCHSPEPGSDEYESSEYETDDDELVALDLPGNPMTVSGPSGGVGSRAAADIEIDALAGVELAIEELDDLDDEIFTAAEGSGCRFLRKIFGGIFGILRPRALARTRRPTKQMVAQLNDPFCDPNTLVYCLFRYRYNAPLVHALLERLEHSRHELTDSYTLHLCYLMLLEPLAAPLEAWLVSRSKTSLHFALQIYWFCQGMIEDADARPGPTHFKRFLKMQRAVQTQVGQLAERKAGKLLDKEARKPSFDRKNRMRTLEATNNALRDALELRTVFTDVTAFVDALAAISVTLRQTEPRSAREATLVYELEGLAATLPEQAHLPAKVTGTFQRVLSVLPAEARSFSTRERNPYLLFLEVCDLQETRPEKDTEGNPMYAASVTTQRRRGSLLKQVIVSPARLVLGTTAVVVGGADRGIRGAVGTVSDFGRERRDKREQRKDVRTAQENDPFTITETAVETTARMQRVAPKAGGRLTPESVSDWSDAAAALRTDRVLQSSAHASVPGWGLAAVIVKADDDLRQEAFAAHLLSSFQRIFHMEGLTELEAGMRPYAIQAASSQSGLVEALTDAVSIAEVKHRMLKTSNTATLEQHYRERFGGSTASEGAPTLAEAQRTCMHSVAAYAVVQYILQMKDRHNGNILIDAQGRMVHIDFAFIFGLAPGGITFEKPAFKLTKEMVDVWGGARLPRVRMR